MVEVDEILLLLKEAYCRVPEARKGVTRCVSYDPAGSNYEFTEHSWSKRIRELLNITYEPTGL